MCKYCKTVLKWKGNDATSGLKSHFQSCKSKPGGLAQKITDVTVLQSSPDSRATTSRQLWTADKNEIKDTVVRFCAKDIRPFSTVEGRGFMELAEKLISIGAKYGLQIMVWDGVGDGDGDGEIYAGIGMGIFLWGRDGDGEYFTGMGWGWEKFDGDGDNFFYRVTLYTACHIACAGF